MHLGLMRLPKMDIEIRKTKTGDRVQLLNRWGTVFFDDPPHKHPSAVIDTKLAVDDLLFVAEYE